MKCNFISMAIIIVIISTVKSVICAVMEFNGIMQAAANTHKLESQ